MKKFLLFFLALTTLFQVVACTGGNTPADTTEGATSAMDVPTDTPTEAPTEEETTEVPFDPTVFVPVALPVANVAREGYALGSATKNDNGYSNLNLNDGDLTTGFSTPWEENKDSAHAYYFFIDLTQVKALDSVKLYPLAGDENGFPKAFDVQVSMDGETYTTVTSIDGATAEAAKDGLEFAVPDSNKLIYNDLCRLAKK